MAVAHPRPKDAGGLALMMPRCRPQSHGVGPTQNVRCRRAILRRERKPPGRFGLASPAGSFASLPPRRQRLRWNDPSSLPMKQHPRWRARGPDWLEPRDGPEDGSHWPRLVGRVRPRVPAPRSTRSVIGKAGRPDPRRHRRRPSLRRRGSDRARRLARPEPIGRGLA